MSAFLRPMSLRGRSGAYLASLLVLFTGNAFGQGQLPDVAPIGSRPSGGGGGSKTPPPEGMPETHAATGAESTLSEGNEPTLPEDPTAINEETEAYIGSDADLEVLDAPSATKRSFYGLYASETAKDYSYRVLFPLWAERIQPSLEDPTVADRASLYGGLYYNRRGKAHRDDIFFPLFWNLENPLESSRTTILGPLVNRRTKLESDDWLVPLYMTGRREHGGYTIIPPLLTGLTSNEEGGLNIVGPAFCSWSGGGSCDTRTAQSIDLGVVPFYFFGQDRQHLYEVIPPLLHYYGYDERSGDWLNVYGPYFRQEKGERSIFHLLPLYYSIWGENERHTTVAPFFHYGYKGNQNLLITPLFLHRTGEQGEKTFATWLYARHRGRTELDMVTPLFWHHREPAIGLDRKLFFPFLYTNTSPREETSVFFPFFSQRERFGVSKSTWVTPLFNMQTHIDGWSWAVPPLAFFGERGNSAHKVVAPFFFDFKGPESRTTIGFPFFFRHDGLESTSTVALNVFHRERRYQNGREWEIHLLPLFSYGQSPDGHFWNVLFGFTGFSRKGSASELRALWIPIQLSQ